jgi:hypothetical protein
MRPLTDRDFEIVNNWEANLPYRFDRTDRVAGERNFDVVIGIIHSRFAGNINETTLNAAVALVLPLLRFEKGYEHPIVKKQLEEKAKADAKAEEDTRALEAARQRELKTRAGIGSDQSQISIEFDRCELNKPKLAANSDELAKIALKDLTNDAFLQEANDIIATHRGPTHGRTAAQQEILRTERDRLIKAKATPEQIRDGVVRKQDSFRNDSVR